ncbi:MAG: SGNH/GDSL hydrolase family protein [Rectinema sp.]
MSTNQGVAVPTSSSEHEKIRILCYGDSNTWGYNPENGFRYPPESRWPAVMKDGFPEGWTVIEEGLPGRTTVFDDPIADFRKGAGFLSVLLETHLPLDLVILMLGTNDTKCRFSVPTYDIGLGLGRLIDEIGSFSFESKGGRTPDILIVAPPPILEIQGTPESFIGAPEKSKRFAEVFQKVAEEKKCLFFDAGQVISSSPIDGLHFSAESQRILGRALAHYLAPPLQERIIYGHSRDR